jgi:hypothetical protein
LISLQTKAAKSRGIRAITTGIICLLLSHSASFAQVTGGQHAFEFLRLSNSAHVSASGGISIANPGQDISFALQNPAMMRPGLHNQLQLSYNSFYADIKVMNLAYGYHSEKINTSFLLGVQYLNYGSFTQTDDKGNINGTFKANDYAITLGASRQYLEHWRYGASLKLANSSLEQYRATALLADIGINYYDTSSLWDFGITAKNMGIMLQKYNPANTAEPMPFDLQLGVSRKFKHLPLRLIATLHHLYQWDVRYNNPADLSGTNALGKNDTNTDNSSHFADKLFRHFIFGAEITLGKRLVVTGSYNYMQRKEMALSTRPGLAGFAFGAGLYLNKFQVHYGRTFYHLSGAYNELSLTMNFNKLISIGKSGGKNNWNTEYPDWE